MFDSATCPWCLKWHREVGQAYSLTDEGRLLPLRRVEAKAPRPADLAGISGIKYTPTFVALDCGVEIGRIIGYQGEDAFYGELAAIATRVKAAGRADKGC